MTGPHDHELANKITKTTVTAETYNIDDTVSRTKETYQVTLRRDNFFKTSYHTSDITANGGRVTRSFGTVKKGNYAVRVTIKSGDATSHTRIKGSGTINQ
ncbi:hypothetical protein J2T56_001364 [Natronobacillus azotifigens]|uniref:Uncharacterized protein n=1 Tax=Natronobacillus azotifigens TaxID=472978 RepID=A0A9J6RCP1_9BACI|nr:hypothetical protein [Natronobacillus azotifigens]MCZ0703068.1 hypothetical protein [Natronobacillus azotifigens]